MPKEVRGIFDGVGDNCYIVVAEGLDEPLNIQPTLLQETVDPETGLPPNLFRSVQWPIPFWAENNGWPLRVCFSTGSRGTFGLYRTLSQAYRNFGSYAGHSRS